MNAAVEHPAPAIEPCRLAPSEAAERRLARRLGQPPAFDELLTASALYGVCPRLLGELYDYWLHDFRLGQQALFRLPGFRLVGGSWALRFWHARSARPAAVPLLMLHGFCGSLSEFAELADALDAAGFHVVCPALDDLAGPWRTLAERCAELMHALGYSRYLVHGSDSGSAIALELAALEEAAVAGVHVTALHAFPSEADGGLAALTSAEKSQLAALSELYERLGAELPESPLEMLAHALARFEEPVATAAWRDALLTGLSSSLLDSSARARAARYRELCLIPSCVARAPIALHVFPLAAPSLRRFAESRHPVREWHEHAQGGPCPALEQPQLLVDSLRSFAEQLA